jgi:hypothetical protein
MQEAKSQKLLSFEKEGLPALLLYAKWPSGQVINGSRGRQSLLGELEELLNIVLVLIYV